MLSLDIGSKMGFSWSQSFHPIFHCSIPFHSFHPMCSIHWIHSFLLPLILPFHSSSIFLPQASFFIPPFIHSFHPFLPFHSSGPWFIPPPFSLSIPNDDSSSSRTFHREKPYPGWLYSWVMMTIRPFWYQSFRWQWFIGLNHLNIFHQPTDIHVILDDLTIPCWPSGDSIPNPSSTKKPAIMPVSLWTIPLDTQLWCWRIVIMRIMIDLAVNQCYASPVVMTIMQFHR